MQGSKIQFSVAESELMRNAAIILTKNEVLKKVKAMLEEVAAAQQEYAAAHPHHLFSVPPKISRGENYEGLPYVILDYPRIATTENFLFLRTMFWWGNFYSCTLQAGGSYKEKIIQILPQHLSLLQQNKFYLGIHADPWQHHFNKDNYNLLSTMTAGEAQERTKDLSFVKLAAQWPLADGQQPQAALFNCWKLLMQLAVSIT